MTIRSVTRVATAATLTLISSLALTACAGGNHGATETGGGQNEKQSSKTPAPEPEVEGFTVGEPFGEAVWSVKASLPSQGVAVKTRDNPVKVRGDRVIIETEGVDGELGIIALDADGAEVWSHEVPQGARVGVLEETVALLSAGTVEGSGLEKDSDVTTLTLLSQKDGSEVVEMQDPDLSVGNSLTEFGEIVTLGEPRKYITEDGEIHEAEQYPEEYVDKIPDLEEGLARIVPIDPSIVELQDAFAFEVRAISRPLDVAVVQIGYGAAADTVTYAVRADTGKVIDKLDCALAEHTDSDTNVAYLSPGGEFGVIESFWLGSDEVHCFAGDDDTKGVQFTAVDDEGTGFGVTGESDGIGDGELAVVDDSGEATVSPLSDGAPAPIGVVDGGLAIHVQGDTITGNPIK